jgi:hypothetical protein
MKQLFIEDAKPGQVAGGYMYIESMRDLDTDRLIAGHWRPATRRERFFFELRRPRFSARFILLLYAVLWILGRIGEYMGWWS